MSTVELSTKEKIKIMQAFVAGEIIEYKNYGYDSDAWLTLVAQNPIWDWRGCEYRIKQKELPKIGSYIWVYDLKIKKSKTLLKVNTIIGSQVYASNHVDGDDNALYEFCFDNNITEWSYIN